MLPRLLYSLIFLAACSKEDLKIQHMGLKIERGLRTLVLSVDPVVYTSDVTLSWNEIKGATTYTISVGTTACDNSVKQVTSIGSTSQKVVLKDGAYVACVSSFEGSQEILKSEVKLFTVVTSAPLKSVNSVVFIDKDITQNSLSGLVQFTLPAKALDIETVSLYWGQSATQVLATNTAPVLSTGFNATLSSLSLPSTALPVGATFFLIFTENRFGKSATPANVAIVDRYPQISSLATLTFASQPTWTQMTGIARANDDLWFVTGSDTPSLSVLLAYKMNVQAVPTLVGQMQGNLCCNGSRLIVDGTRIFNNDPNLGLHIYDYLGDGSSAVSLSAELASINSVNPLWAGMGGQTADDLSKYGNYLYVAGNNINMVTIFNMTDPTAIPATTNFLTTGGETGLKIANYQNRLYVNADSSQTLYIYDLSIPTAPSLITTLASGACSSGNLVHSCMSFNNGVMAQLNSLTTSVSLYQVNAGLTSSSTITLPAAGTGVQLEGNYLFVTTPTTLSAYNVVDPAHPVLAVTTANVGQTSQADVSCSVTKGICLTSGGNADPHLNVFRLDGFTTSL